MMCSVVVAKTPDIRIKIGEYPRDVQFQCPQGGTWVLGSKKGSVKPGETAVLSGALKEKSRITHHVMVESIPMREEEKLTQHLNAWKATGRPVHTLVLGKASYAEDQKTITYDGRVVFIGLGAYEEPEPAQKLVDELAALGSSSYILEEVQALSQGGLSLKIGKKTVATGMNVFRIIPNGLVGLKKVEHAKGYSWHGFADRNYRGPMTIQWGARNALDCILTTDLETLIAGVVPSEISSKAAIGALQAQAVAARGEILSKIGLRHLKEGFDFCAEQHCQVFAGETAESLRMSQAIRPTQGVVMHDQEGGIVDAVYAANCGGHSEANHLVWTSPPSPQLMGVWDCETPLKLDLQKNEKDVRTYISMKSGFHCADATVEGGDKFRWQKVLSGKDWQEVEERGQVGRIREVKDFERGVSGRLCRLTLVGEKGNRSIMKELPIRKLFGGLRSACFIVEWNRDDQGFINGAVFQGAGWGHGVGMCQTGAQFLAKVGWDYQKILSHYFTASRFVKIY